MHRPLLGTITVYLLLDGIVIFELVIVSIHGTLVFHGQQRAIFEVLCRGLVGSLAFPPVVLLDSIPIETFLLILLHLLHLSNIHSDFSKGIHSGSVVTYHALVRTEFTEAFVYSSFVDQYILAVATLSQLLVEGTLVENPPGYLLPQRSNN